MSQKHYAMERKYLRNARAHSEGAAEDSGLYNTSSWSCSCSHSERNPSALKVRSIWREMWVEGKALRRRNLEAVSSHTAWVSQSSPLQVIHCVAAEDSGLYNKCLK